MRFQPRFWWEAYFYVFGAVSMCFGVLAKSEWLSGFNYRDGSPVSPRGARVILIVTGIIAILITYYDFSQRH